jgi:ferritin-like metal-binding protein YciE
LPLANISPQLEREGNRMKLESLRELLIKELQDLYSAENMIVKALPKMVEKASSPDLKNAFNQHLEQTRTHVMRLEQIFRQIRGADREDKKCKGMEGIIKENEETLKQDAEPEVRDAGIISGAQRVEHYEIATYGTVRTYAQLLGEQQWAQLLQQTLDEEKQTDQKLSGIAERINVEARAA